MARTWLSVTVELLGGGGTDLWPWPGRILAVGPRHTFGDLAEAINDAFARWDRSHLSMFTLADGTLVTDPDTGAEITGCGAPGPIVTALDLATTVVARTVRPGDEFQFTFDLGDNWTHLCTVGPQKIDPEVELGIVPDAPLPYWGWGSIPDQYGRRWDCDDGESPVPRRPSQPHPMRTHEWPQRHLAPTLDIAALRTAIAENDAGRFLAAITGCDIDDALQQVGAGIPLALRRRRAAAEPVALSIINRLTVRAADGDDILAADLLALLRREPLAGRVAPVDLEDLGSEMEGDSSMSLGGFVDLRDGQVYDENATDAGIVGEDAAIDVEADPDRWLPFRRTGSHDAWQDMAAFADRQRDEVLRQRLQRAIQGSGAFHRFRDLVHEAGLAEAWYGYSTDRQIGRAREFLAGEGIRVG